eukprot:426088-Pelagomonas_calceolata.AAC.3
MLQPILDACCPVCTSMQAVPQQQERCYRKKRRVRLLELHLQHKKRGGRAYLSCTSTCQNWSSRLQYCVCRLSKSWAASWLMDATSTRPSAPPWAPPMPSSEDWRGRESAFQCRKVREGTI